MRNKLEFFGLVALGTIVTIYALAKFAPTILAGIFRGQILDNGPI